MNDPAQLQLEEILRRFDVPGPRYTSYPTIDRFVEAVDSSLYEEALHARVVGGLQKPLSIYVHIPFCESLCYYCACNKVITKDKSKSEEYLRVLYKEIALVKSHVGAISPVTQMHFGGGSPTFLHDEQLEQLILRLEETFPFTSNAERSIEIDPRTVSVSRLELLRHMGFNRISFGVQDFDAQVQKAVHRIGPFETIKKLMCAANSLVFDSVNVDLIYGLPKQTLASFKQTLEQVISLSPDRIVVYAYAHLPERFKPQRRIHSDDLPTSIAKVDLLRLAIDVLCAAGYDYIGMDHFAKSSDALAVAKRQGRLHRNFQGYTTQPDCDLIGLGVSAISRVGLTYAQNVRTLPEYYDAIAEHELPVFRGFVCQADDVIRNAIIMGLMCQGYISFSDIEQAYWIQFREAFAQELRELTAFADDGLIRLNMDSIEVTEIGWFVVRAIAMVFDRYANRHRSPVGFSKVL